MIIYLSGRITGNPRYHKEFETAEKVLSEQGHIVLNPATLPEGLPRKKYMPICLAMLEAADAVIMLQGWQDSKGAQVEKAYAEYQRKIVCYEMEAR